MTREMLQFWLSNVYTCAPERLAAKIAPIHLGHRPKLPR
jgi:hypothetical protein